MELYLELLLNIYIHNHESIKVVGNKFLVIKL